MPEMAFNPEQQPTAPQRPGAVLATGAAGAQPAANATFNINDFFRQKAGYAIDPDSFNHLIWPAGFQFSPFNVLKKEEYLDKLAKRKCPHIDRFLSGEELPTHPLKDAQIREYFESIKSSRPVKDFSSLSLMDAIVLTSMAMEEFHKIHLKLVARHLRDTGTTSIYEFDYKDAEGSFVVDKALDRYYGDDVKDGANTPGISEEVKLQSTNYNIHLLHHLRDIPKRVADAGNKPLEQQKAVLAEVYNQLTLAHKAMLNYIGRSTEYHGVLARECRYDEWPEVNRRCVQESYSVYTTLLQNTQAMVRKKADELGVQLVSAGQGQSTGK